MMPKKFSIAAIAALGFSALAVVAEEYPANLEIIPGFANPNGTHVMAFALSLDPDWKTYWRSPGDAGIPPAFDWSSSTNVRDVEFHWPRPTDFEAYGLRTRGFEGELVLPVTITPERASERMHVGGTVKLGVCREVCLVIELPFGATLPAEGGKERINQALSRVPEQFTVSQTAGHGPNCETTPISDGMRITMTLDNVEPIEMAIIEYSDQSIWVSDTDVSSMENRVELTAEMVPVQAAPFELDPNNVILTVLSFGGDVEYLGCIPS